MSAKLRITAWFTLMVLLMAAIVLVFVLVINNAAITDDPADRLIKTVENNADNLEFDHGSFDWSDVSIYRRGIYSSFFSQDGELLKGAFPYVDQLSLPFEENKLLTVNIEGADYYVFDTYVDMDITGIWIRGVVDSADRSGVMHTILVLTCSLLPALLVLSVVGGWFIAKRAFRPMEQIMNAANSIGDGSDLSARVGLKRGPSEMKRLSNAFDRMFCRLESSFNAERQFSSDASHELRTPITIILAECDRAKRKCFTREDFLATIDSIEEQGQNMSELVQQLLSLTRLQYGGDKYPMRNSDLSGLISACSNEFTPEDDRGITFEADIAENVTAVYNPTLMARITHNLLQNAYKYGKDGGHIRLRLYREGNRAVMSVTDDGIGIAPEALDKIWQRFWQADPSRTSEGGSGLGLAMVKEMTEFQGGTVKVESVLNQGSTFTVSLPA